MSLSLHIMGVLSLFFISLGSLNVWASDDLDDIFSQFSKDFDHVLEGKGPLSDDLSIQDSGSKKRKAIWKDPPSQNDWTPTEDLALLSPTQSLSPLVSPRSSSSDFSPPLSPMCLSSPSSSDLSSPSEFSFPSVSVTSSVSLASPVLLPPSVSVAAPILSTSSSPGASRKSACPVLKTSSKIGNYLGLIVSDNVWTKDVLSRLDFNQITQPMEVPKTSKPSAPQKASRSKKKRERDCIDRTTDPVPTLPKVQFLGTKSAGKQLRPKLDF